jgi:hypothetical protein
MPEPIRSAEKSRTSTCTLADIAALEIMKTLKTLRNEPKSESLQEVVAGVLVTVNQKTIHVISIGLGNKFNARGVKEDTRVRDCHAEVLARRSFKLWLLTEFEALERGDHSKFFTLEDGKLARKADVAFFLYISSCPCGNACIRRWGDSPKEKLHLTNEKLGIPQFLSHPSFHAHARHEGQLAVSFKGESNILSCSDKILRWNVLGLQGLALSGILIEPLFLDGIIIGRKFVRKHTERAFCCRLTAKGVNKQIKDRIRHPVVMCTSAKMDEGTFKAQDGGGASFDQTAMWWMLGRKTAEFIDGTSGTKRDSPDDSEICKASLYQKRLYLKIPDPPVDMIRLSDLLDMELNKL